MLWPTGNHFIMQEDKNKKRGLDIPIKYRIFISRSFATICFFLAGYYMLSQVVEYLKNEDVSVFSYKRYNDAPREKYPTFSICLWPSIDDILEYGNNLYQEQTIQRNLNMSGVDYFDMLTGSSFRGDGLTNFSLLQFDEAKWELSKMISTYVAYSNQEEPLVYWDTEISNTSVPTFLFYPGYQSPDRFCFTRNNSYFPSKRIHTEIVHLDVEDWIGDLFVYLHYPGELMNVIGQGERKKLRLQNSNLNGKKLKIGITQLQVLKRRHDSRVPCNKDLESNVDMRWRESVMSIVGCIPTYWRGLPQSVSFQALNFDDCTRSQQYKSFFDYNLYTTDPNITYDPSCTWPTIYSNLLFEDTNNRIQNFMFELKHESQYYVEVKNLKATTFDDLWCQIGGLVGVFLGCSLIQFPDFLFKLFSLATSFLFDKDKGSTT